MIARLVVLVALLAPGAAHAIPRFAARNGAPCSLCHVNPSGAGLRTAFGRGAYARQRLPSPYLSRLAGEGGAPLVEPRLGDAITLGADLRAGYLRAEPKSGPPTTDSFFLMQADLYVGADLGRHTTLYVDLGALGSYEAFGMLHFGMREPAEAAPPTGEAPPDPRWAGYLKVGRFVPAYGLKLEHHATFVRETLGFLSTFRDTGVELGVYLGPLLLQAAYVRGAFTDKNPEGTAYARLEHLIRTNLVRGMAGASISHSPRALMVNPAIGRRIVVDAGVEELRFGGHVGLSIGRFTYLGELDRVSVLEPNARDEGKALVAYQELSFVPVQGLDVQVSHEYWDDNLELARGRLQRWTGGVELYPWDFTELKVFYRRTLGPSDHALADLQEVVALLHLFF